MSIHCIFHVICNRISLFFLSFGNSLVHSNFSRHFLVLNVPPKWQQPELCVHFQKKTLSCNTPGPHRTEHSVQHNFILEFRGPFIEAFIHLMLHKVINLEYVHKLMMMIKHRETYTEFSLCAGLSTSSSSSSRCAERMDSLDSLLPSVPILVWFLCLMTYQPF